MLFGAEKRLGNCLLYYVVNEDGYNGALDELLDALITADRAEELKQTQE